MFLDYYHVFVLTETPLLNVAMLTGLLLGNNTRPTYKAIPRNWCVLTEKAFILDVTQ